MLMVFCVMVSDSLQNNQSSPMSLYRQKTLFTRLRRNQHQSRTQTQVLGQNPTLATHVQSRDIDRLPTDDLTVLVDDELLQEGSGELAQLDDRKFQSDIASDHSVCFSILPKTVDVENIYIRIKRDPLSYMWKSLELEDFAELPHLRPQMITTTLHLNTTLTMSAADRVNGFYNRVARNLRNALPNLVHLEIGGGYHYEAENGTAENLQSDFANLQQNLAAMVAALKKYGVTVSAIQFVVEYNFPIKVVDQVTEKNTDNESMLKNMLVNMFSPSNIYWWDKCSQLLFETDGVPVELLVMLTAPLPRRQLVLECASELKEQQNSNAHVLFDRSECIKQVFKPDLLKLNAAEYLYLEDFFNLNHVQPQFTLRTLNLSVSVANTFHLPPTKFYQQAVANLRRAAPNLEILGFHGTLRYYPLISEMAQLREELTQIQRSIEAASRFLRINFEQVEWNESPIFVFSLDKELLKRLQGGELIKTFDIFNYHYLELSNGRVRLRFSSDVQEQEANFVLTTSYPQGYSALL